MGNEQSQQRCVAPPTELQSALDTQEVLIAPISAGAAPSPRETAGCAAKFANRQSGLVLFGGHGEQPEDNELWALGPDQKWARVESDAGRKPGARSGHTAAWVSGVGLIVFGGLSHEKGRYLSDCHLLSDDGLKWTALSTTGVDLPCARDKHTAVVLASGATAETGSSNAAAAQGARMLVFGGFGVLPKEEDEDEDEDEAAEDGQADDGQPGDAEGEESRGPSVSMGWFDDVFALDCTDWRWAKITTDQPTSERPSARAAHTCCVLPSAAEAGGCQQMVLFGGRTVSGRSNDTWVLECEESSKGASWSKPEVAGVRDIESPPHPPPPRPGSPCDVGPHPRDVK